MRQKIAPVLLFVVGAVVLRLALFGDFLDYVKPSQGPLLIVAGALLMVCGLVGVVHDMRRDGAEPAAPTARSRRATLHTHGPLRVDPAVIEQVRQKEHDHGHDHSRTPGVAWLLMLPMFLVLLVPPPALGAYAASRAGAPVPQPLAHREYLPLPAGGPVPLAVHDYAERAAWDGGRTLVSRTVTLTGFVTPKDDGGWYLTRIMITCCAADSRSYLVEVVGSGRSPAANAWERVTGTYTPGAPTAQGGKTARITATAVTPADQPQNPYELP